MLEEDENEEEEDEASVLISAATSRPSSITRECKFIKSAGAEAWAVDAEEATALADATVARVAVAAL